MPSHFLNAIVALLFSLGVSSGASQAQQTGWRDQIGTFKIGLVVQPGQPQPDRDLIRDAFSKKLGMPVEVVLSRDYPSLIDAQASGRVDYAVYSSLAYAASARFCECVAPLVLPIARVEGKEGVQGTGQRVVIRKRGDTTTASKPRLVAVQDGLSFQAWDLVNTERGFPSDVEIVPAVTQGDARKLFVEDKADMLLDWELVSDDGEAVGSAGLDVSSVEAPAWQSSMILPLGVHAVRKTIPGQARELLLSLMEGEDADSLHLFEQLEPVHNAGFTRATETDVAPAIAFFDKWVEARRSN